MIQRGSYFVFSGIKQGPIIMHFRSLIAVIVFSLFSAIPAHAVSLSEVIRKCGDDGKALCKGVGYGQPMQDCLVAKKSKVSPQCKPIIDRLEKGEKVGIFG